MNPGGYVRAAIVALFVAAAGVLVYVFVVVENTCDAAGGCESRLVSLGWIGTGLAVVGALAFVGLLIAAAVAKTPQN